MKCGRRRPCDCAGIGACDGMLDPDMDESRNLIEDPGGACESAGSAIPADYGLTKGQVVYLRCEVSAIKDNCVIAVRPVGMGFPSADFNVHRNDIVELPNA